MNSIPRTSGIYQILCVPTGKIYIGSAVNLRQRWGDHRKTLRGNRHINAHLQYAWNKYGESAFDFSVLEQVMFAEYLIEREQVWMDRLHVTDKQRGFNIASQAGSTLGVALSQDRKDKIAATKEHVWEGFIDPSGNEVTITNLRAFCREHNLDCSTMHRLSSGKPGMAYYHGWTHKNCKPTKFTKTREPYMGFISPDGFAYPPITNLSAFCREHGLLVSSMNYLYWGKIKSHKGWTCKRAQDDI